MHWIHSDLLDGNLMGRLYQNIKFMACVPAITVPMRCTEEVRPSANCIVLQSHGELSGSYHFISCYLVDFGGISKIYWLPMSNMKLLPVMG